MNCMHIAPFSSRRIGRRGLTRGLGLALFVVAVAAAPAANAQAVNLVELPPIPKLSPNVGPGQSASAVATSVQGNAFAETRGPGNPTQKGESYTSLLAWSDDAAFRKTEDTRSVTAVAETTATTFANSIAIATPGRLRAQATAGGGGGYNLGFANSSAMFVDTVTLVHGGGYHINLDVDGSITGGAGAGRETTDYATARMSAQVWWVPYEVNLGQASQSPFLGSYHQSVTWEYNHLTGSTGANASERVFDYDAESPFKIYEEEGTKFWVVGLVEVDAGRNSSGFYQASFLTATANFANTVTLTVESENFPGTSDVISASGHDYSPNAVPEPTSLAMVAAPIGILAMMRRARRI